MLFSLMTISEFVLPKISRESKFPSNVMNSSLIGSMGLIGFGSHGLYSFSLFFLAPFFSEDFALLLPGAFSDIFFLRCAAVLARGLLINMKKEATKVFHHLLICCLLEFDIYI